MPFLISIKELLQKVLPPPIFRKIHMFVRQYVMPVLSKRVRIRKKYENIFIDRYGYRVISGPFEGMQYINRSTGSVFLLKMIGCYEATLHETISRIGKENYDTIIDIGCAEGYYLIGLGRMFSSASLVGFDTDKEALVMSQELATKNNIQNRLTLEKECTGEKLSKIITSNTLIVCDAEGFESIILDTNNNPDLRKVKTIIVEIHDHVVPNLKEKITNWYQDTHFIKELAYDNSNYSKYPFLSEIEDQQELEVLTEEREIKNQAVMVIERIA